MRENQVPNTKTNSRKSPTEKGEDEQRQGGESQKEGFQRVKCGGEGEKRRERRENEL